MSQAPSAHREPPTARPVPSPPFVISGIVQPGRRLGRTLGFPTANVPLPPDMPVPFGVYVVRSELEDGTRVFGVASVGLSPTVGNLEPLLEVNLFDFAGDLYGRRLRTDLIVYLRGEARFPDLDSLKAQIARDVAQGRSLLPEITARAGA